MSARLYFASVVAVVSFSTHADPGGALSAPGLTLQDLAIFSEAVVIVSPKVVTALPAETGGAVALWVEKALKGRLQGGRDIIWVPRNELPKAEVNGPMWLLFLTQMGNGAWRIQTGKNEKNLISIDSLQAPVIAEVSKHVGAYGPPPEPEPAAAEEIALWVKKAARGSRSARQDAFTKLLAAGDSARPELLEAAGSQDRETANVARTLLPLTGGGPAVHQMRLVLEPAALELSSGQSRMISVNFANLSGRDMPLVTGTGAQGDLVLASSAYILRPLSAQDAKTSPQQPALPTVMPSGYGATIAGGAPPLPLIRNVPNFGVLPMPVRVELENVVIDGKPELRLKFPHGYITIPGPGKYSLRARFACPGPRPDQERLQSANYWGGGQLVSNDIVLIVK